MEIGETRRNAEGGNAKYLVYTDGSQAARPKWPGACASASCRGLFLMGGGKPKFALSREFAPSGTSVSQMVLEDRG